jgi:hypothetical protein
VKASNVFPSATLRAADIEGHEPIVTIDKVTMQDFNGERKPLITFRGKDKALVCNVTNWNAIVEATGEADSDDWSGKKIKLYVAKVEYQGKRVPAIRVEAVTAPRQVAPPAVVEEDIDDESVPF